MEASSANAAHRNLQDDLIRPTNACERVSAALEVGDQTLAGFDQLVRFDAEHVVPRAGCRPHLVVLQQVRIDEHAQVRRMTEGRHAAVGF
ncbi:MAG: hypothetical protein RLZ04_1825 [Actinomycetota bacterium]